MKAPRTNGDRFLWWVLIPILVMQVLVFGGLVVRYVVVEQIRADERTRLGNAIEDYRGRHGRYPPSLAEAGVTPDPMIFATVSYTPCDDGQRVWFSVELGWFMGIRYWQYETDIKTWSSHLED